jgi:hypothetical protein
MTLSLIVWFHAKLLRAHTSKQACLYTLLNKLSRLPLNRFALVVMPLKGLRGARPVKFCSIFDHQIGKRGLEVGIIKLFL